MYKLNFSCILHIYSTIGGHEVSSEYNLFYSYIIVFNLRMTNIYIFLSIFSISNPWRTNISFELCNYMTNDWWRKAAQLSHLPDPNLFVQLFTSIHVPLKTNLQVTIAFCSVSRNNQYHRKLIIIDNHWKHVINSTRIFC